MDVASGEILEDVVDDRVIPWRPRHTRERPKRPPIVAEGFYNYDLLRFVDIAARPAEYDIRVGFAGLESNAVRVRVDVRP